MELGYAPSQRGARGKACPLSVGRGITAKTISGKDLTRILERRNWTLLRVHGSHYYYESPDGGTRLSIPVHGNRDLKSGIQRAIMKDAGLTDEDL